MLRVFNVARFVDISTLCLSQKKNTLWLCGCAHIGWGHTWRSFEAEHGNALRTEGRPDVRRRMWNLPEMRNGRKSLFFEM